MGIRVLSTLLLLAMLSVAHQPVAQDLPLDEKAARKLVEEYVNAGTSQNRRDEIAQLLATGSEYLTQRVIRPMIEDESKRSRALELGAILVVPGLFNTAKKYIDSVDEENIVKIGCAAQDGGALTFLINRWKTVDTDSLSFGYLEEGFTNNQLPWDAIASFKPALTDKDEKRKHSAMVIASIQLGTQAHTVEWLIQKWPDLERDYLRDSQRFATKGVDLFAKHKPVTTGSVTRIGRNFRLADASTISVPAAEEWNIGSFTINVRVRVNDGSGVAVFLRSKGHWWSARFTGKDWAVLTADKTEYTTPGAAQKWTTISFKVTDKSEPGQRYRRDLTISIDDKAVLPLAWQNGEYQDLHIVSGDSKIAVAAAEFVKS